MHEEVKKYFKEIGHKGGKARVAKMTKEQIRLACSKAGKGNLGKKKTKIKNLSEKEKKEYNRIAYKKHYEKIKDDPDYKEKRRWQFYEWYNKNKEEYNKKRRKKLSTGKTK